MARSMHVVAFAAALDVGAALRHTIEGHSIVNASAGGGWRNHLRSALADPHARWDRAEPLDSDEQDIFKYLIGKAGEIENLPEDVRLAWASWQAQLMAIHGADKQVNVKVAGLHQLHPVGTWREDTWSKTNKRKRAILDSKTTILNRGGVLTEDDMQHVGTLSAMRSITPFVAVPFPFCGNGHVLLEGNGRLMAMKLAAAEDPSFADLSVEVTLKTYTDQEARLMQEGIALLWNQYVTSIDAMNASTEEGRIAAYTEFKVGVVRCGRGVGPFVVDVGPCSVVDDKNKKIGEVKAGELFGVSSVGQGKDGSLKYELCSRFSSHTGPAYVSALPSQVEELCPTCFPRV